MEKLNVKYLGHACFKLVYKGQRIVLDPYLSGMVPGLRDVDQEAEFVFCSHQHEDHNYVEGVRLTTGCVPGFRVETLETDHDDAGGTLRGRNTVHIFDFDGIRAAHLGDLGRQLTAEETERLSGLDLVFIPVGGVYTLDPVGAKAVLEAIKPGTAVLMHYRTDNTGLGDIGHINEAISVLGGGKHIGCRMEIEAGESRGIVVMTPDNAGVGEWAVSRHTRGCNCCQSVLCALQEYTGLSYDDAVSLGYGFASGMFCGSVCGAVTGGLMAIGKAVLPGNRLFELKPAASGIAAEFEKRFKEKFGTLMCAEIVGRYRHQRCNECVAHAAAEAEKMIIKLKKEI